MSLSLARSKLMLEEFVSGFWVHFPLIFDDDEQKRENTNKCEKIIKYFD